MSHAHSHHITSLPALFATFGALIFLTVLTVVLADPEHFEFGRLDMVVTMGIAVVKAALVALIFMQLMHDKLLNSVILVGSLMFLALFLGISLMDSLQYQHQISSYVDDNLPAPVTPVVATPAATTEAGEAEDPPTTETEATETQSTETETTETQSSETESTEEAETRSVEPAPAETDSSESVPTETETSETDSSATESTEAPQ